MGDNNIYVTAGIVITVLMWLALIGSFVGFYLVTTKRKDRLQNKMNRKLQLLSNFLNQEYI